MRPTIAVLDYRVGNTSSVANALERLGCRVRISREKDVLKGADALVLPGVGAFSAAMEDISIHGLDEILTEVAHGQKKPVLGICLGMQILATDSEEGGVHAGLNWIPGHVRKLSLPPEFRVPNVGWKAVEVNAREPLYERLQTGQEFYFDHSYHFVCDQDHAIGWTQYGMSVVAAVRKDNIYGVQFHPEKSQKAGLRLLRGFLNIVQGSHR